MKEGQAEFTQLDMRDMELEQRNEKYDYDVLYTHGFRNHHVSNYTEYKHSEPVRPWVADQPGQQSYPFQVLQTVGGPDKDDGQPDAQHGTWRK